MPKFIVNLFCIHITSGMKHCADVESELDKRWLQYKMCNSAVNAISEIFIKSSKFLDLREISEVLRKAPPSPPLHHLGAKVTSHLLLFLDCSTVSCSCLKKSSSSVLEPLQIESFCSLVCDFSVATPVNLCFLRLYCYNKKIITTNFLS